MLLPRWTLLKMSTIVILPDNGMRVTFSSRRYRL